MHVDIIKAYGIQCGEVSDKEKHILFIINQCVSTSNCHYYLLTYLHLQAQTIIWKHNTYEVRVYRREIKRSFQLCCRQLSENLQQPLPELDKQVQQ